jgi:HD domain
MRPVRSSQVETIGLVRWWILLAQATPLAATHLIGLLRYYGFGARGDPLADPLPGDLPQSGWIAAIDEALDRDVKMDKVFRDHSQRSWFFARALAAAKGDALDNETLYAACLLHDAGLFDEDRKTCFALVGADLVRKTAAAAGVNTDQAKAAAVAVATHIDVRPQTQLANYLRAGTLLDVIGTFAWDIDPAAIAEACERWPRTGFEAEARRLWNEESDRFPYGRAQFARMPGALPQLIMFNPLPN